LLSKEIGSGSEQSAGRLDWAQGRIFKIAVAGECEDAVSEGNSLILERVSVEISDVILVLLNPARDLVFHACPEEVVPKIT